MNPKTVFVFSILFIFQLVNFSIQAEEEFCYKDPECSDEGGHWGGFCNSKKAQSPVNISKAESSPLPHRKKLNFHEGYKVDSYYIVNMGDTVQVRLNKEPTSKANLTSDSLSGNYTFSQMHFHWGTDEGHGSEHRLEGVQFSMEAHLVHYSSKFTSLDNAIKSNEDKAVAVIGIFLDIAGSPDPKAAATLNQIADVIPDYNNKEPQLISQKLDLYSLLPSKGDKLYEYSGSLTTPGCNEIVWWFVKSKPIKISSADVQKFMAMKGSDGKIYGFNFRYPKRKLKLRPFEVSLYSNYNPGGFF